MKKMTSSLLATLMATLIAGASGIAAAHGDETHAKKSGPVKKEQKEWGIAGDAKAVNRTITFTMTDNMRFTPDKIDVKQGETIRFVIKNGGQTLHEMVIGTPKDLEAHAALMMKFPTMAHEEPYMAHVGPGKTGEIIWTFNKPGTFDFACLIAGHYQAGMTGKVTVVASR
ncbi:cupredoxin domain-containing protein [Polaromonas jejuensis]|uniref:Cupredoxin domain-containing protein n=1 Tax=Polaromonas jejuensis TaxID=457502 RepID=A0ABW0Q4D3_9BURK|nr:cupredoxin family protein [Polaromonas jejuensis]